MDTIEGKTSAQLRAEAADCLRREEESFDRSDTDGFLSQWAMNMTARLKRAQADLLDDGGLALFIGLYDGDRRLKARVVKTKFGSRWLLHDDEQGRYGTKFLPAFTGGRSRKLKALGLQERHERDRGFVKVMGSGTGLSGCASAFVGTERHRDTDPWGQAAKLDLDAARRAGIA